MAFLRRAAQPVRGLGAIRLALVMLLIALPMRAASGSEIRVGDRLPEVTLSDWQGRPMRLASLRGEVVIIDFWASWCKACVALLPALNTISREQGPAGLVVVAVSIDTTRSDAERFLAQHVPGVEMMLLHDPGGAVLARFGAPGMPALYVVDADGTVRLVKAGYTTEELKTVEGFINELLSDASTAHKGGRNDDTNR